MTAAPTIRIQGDDFDVGRETAAIREPGADVGAIVTFTGLRRSEDNRLATLEIEHYPGMAQAEVTRIVGEATRRWPLLEATVIHRHGKMRAGENIVLVIVASSHRQAAFAAAEFLMDWLKSSAPFWKREHHADGTVGEWVEAKASDELAMRSWDDAPDTRERQSRIGKPVARGAGRDNLPSRQERTGGTVVNPPVDALDPGTPLIDPFGRTITYLRVSVTDRCDFRCVYCMAEDMTFLPKSRAADARGARPAVHAPSSTRACASSG